MSATPIHLEYNWENGKEISIRVSLLYFEEDKNQIVYCPPLDVYGYGANENEAFDSFKTCLGEFFQYTINKKTIISELQKLGWVIPKSKYKNMSSPPLSKLLSENDNFRRIFDNFSFRKEEHEILMPA